MDKTTESKQIEKLQAYILKLENAVKENDKELIKEMEIRIIDMYFMK